MCEVLWTCCDQVSDEGPGLIQPVLGVIVGGSGGEPSSLGIAVISKLLYIRIMT